jgi:fermentation-respiration switch protein FrsA (DUF1100 family)
MLGQAEMLLRHDYTVLLPDARAHGESGGNIATYGVLEADDVRHWVEWLQQNDRPRCIDAIGESMGAADLLRSLSVESAYCAVVAESVFSTFRDVAYDRVGQAFHSGPWLGRTLLRPAVTFGFAYAEWKYGVDLARASPLESVAKSPTPVLLIHGQADNNVPPVHSERIKAHAIRVALWEPEGAGHCGASGTAPAAYENHILEWFAAHDLQPIALRDRR